MAVYKLKKDVKETNLRSIKKWIKKDKVAEFEPYGTSSQRIVIKPEHKVEVAGPDKGTPVYGGYIAGTEKVDEKKKFYLVTSIKGNNPPNMVPKVDLYVFAEDVDYIP